MLLCEAASSQLVIVDVQQRLAAAIPAESLDLMTKNSALLLDAAAILGVPTLCSEQYPTGLGATLTAIAEHLPGDIEKIEKTCFSCTGAEAFQQHIGNSGCRQIVLAGMESHVCILQSAVQLAQQGQEVFVVEDAVCSRREIHHRNAMERMRQAGIIITNTESVIFEWMRDARHEHFREISALLK
ncbi:MAG: isochorismatase family protein [Pseudomonadota bacterium]|nr:isochorismatase family protein [Pseudomonadota bacterium]